MKKILFLLLCLPIMVLADDCNDTYKTGVSLYKAGKYAEAQRKFIAIAKICGDYANVYQYLWDCNQKMADKQAQQATEIASLKIEKKKLTADFEQEKEKNNNQRIDLRKAASQIEVLRLDTVSKNKEISNYKLQLQQLNDTIQQLQQAKDSLQESLVSSQKKMTMLQEGMGNNSKKKEKKQSTSKKKSDSVDSATKSSESEKK